MDRKKFDEIIRFIRSLYPNEEPVPLHAPRFLGNEKKYLMECVDTTFVSYVGKFVTEFEDHVKRVTGAGQAVAMVNGTAALQMVLLAAGAKAGDEVLTQSLTFVATAAAIKHVAAEPVFVDVDRETLGMSPESLENYLRVNAEERPEGVHDRMTGRRIIAIMPMHTFGQPARIDEIAMISQQYGIQLIEDSAESLGSLYKGRHTGRFGRAAVLSFNGNKPVTTGGGGMVISDDGALAEWVRTISTTAKRKHRWEFVHDEVGYNLRLPNLNAALGCAQMEYFERIIHNKRKTAELYADFFSSIGVSFFREPQGACANYWLNTIVLEDRATREAFLEHSNNNGVQTRPVWTPMHQLRPYRECARGPLPNAEWLADRIVNIPSSVRVVA
jgi:aminotransferase in exopolysaccharide biosynthesis